MESKGEDLPAELQALLGLSAGQKLQLVSRFLAVEHRERVGVEILRGLYPIAPESMHYSASWHYFYKLPEQALDCAVAIAWSYEHRRVVPIETLTDLGHSYYNWLALSALLAGIQVDVAGTLEEIKECLARNDLDAVSSMLNSLHEQVTGMAQPPRVD